MNNTRVTLKALCQLSEETNDQFLSRVGLLMVDLTDRGYKEIRVTLSNDEVLGSLCGMVEVNANPELMARELMEAQRELAYVKQQLTEQEETSQDLERKLEEATGELDEAKEEIRKLEEGENEWETTLNNLMSFLETEADQEFELGGSTWVPYEKGALDSAFEEARAMSPR